MSQAQRAHGNSEPQLQRDAELLPIPVEIELLRQKIVASLRRAIELGTLRAGDRLVEKDLCGRLGVSRTSLREALRDLEAHRVVTKISARELVVTPVSAEDAANMYGVRGAIETLIAEQFIDNASDTDIESLRTALERVRNSDPTGGGYLDAQRDFYQVWCKGAANPFAFDLLMNIQLRLSVIRSEKIRKPELQHQNVAEKAAILESMAQRDVEGARNAVRTHIRNATRSAVSSAHETLSPRRKKK